MGKKLNKRNRAFELKMNAQLREARLLSDYTKNPPWLACDIYADLEKECPKGRIEPKPKSKMPLISHDTASLFYMSSDWIKLRDFTIQKYGRKCMCCGDTERKICVDHIQPLRRFWQLRLVFSNLQILCEPCNLLKGNWTTIDFRRMNPKQRRKWLRKDTFYEERLTQYVQQQIDLAGSKLRK